LDGRPTTPDDKEDEHDDDDDPEAKARKAQRNARQEFHAREAALKLNYSGEEEFDFKESRITSLLQPVEVKGPCDSAPPIHESINCDYGVTYVTEIKGDKNNTKP